MKRKSIICMLSLSMMLGMSSTSCQDMLSPDSERHAYTVAQDTLYSYWGILRSLQNIAERYVILNECRGDFVDATGFVSDSIYAILNFGEPSELSDPEKVWKDGACAYLRVSDYYHIINSCNAYIAQCDTSRATGINQPYMLKEYSQVQAIRAWVYMQLLYAYGPNRVPFFTEPLLTTDAINNFLADKSREKLTSDVLVRELAPILERMEEVEKTYGLPQYRYYGNMTVPLCHSSKCMFPVSIVLGDLYLLDNKYPEAALHYYNFIKSKNGGPLVTNKYYSLGDLDDRVDYPLYEYSGVPYNETGAVGRDVESITCIFSNEGKLDGKVLTDINRLFGFEAEMSSFSNGLEITIDEKKIDVDLNTILLSRNYEHELMPSKGYEALCDSQKYEIYVGTTTGGNFDFEGIEELPGVGDARRAWIYYDYGFQYTFRVGDDYLYGKMVSKQNPYEYFSTTYPVIYRKSTVWLRYAEALNRAGFPSYAFAILKTGLCNNKEWFPPKPSEVYGTDGPKAVNAQPLGKCPYYYPAKDSLLFYTVTDYVMSDEGDVTEVKTILPEGWDTNNKMETLAKLKTYIEDYFQKEYNASQATDEPMTEPRQFDEANVSWLPASAESFKNTPRKKTGETYACYFLDRRELELAANTPYLNIKEVAGQNQTQTVYYKEQGKLYRAGSNIERLPSTPSADKLYTIGVHQRGCGFVRYDDPEEYRSSYNYVDQVKKKVKDATGRELSEDEIYNGGDDIQKLVQDAVEDLIIDECGLELAFEGTRFSDLCRVAKRRGNPDYLAERVSKRHTGKVEDGGKLHSWLLNEDHWYLPLPEE